MNVIGSGLITILIYQAYLEQISGTDDFVLLNTEDFILLEDGSNFLLLGA